MKIKLTKKKKKKLRSKSAIKKAKLPDPIKTNTINVYEKDIYNNIRSESAAILHIK